MHAKCACLPACLYLHVQAADSAGQGLQCTLEVQVMLPRAKPRKSSGASGEGSWTTIWERPVLFSDDAARIRELQVCVCVRASQLF